MKLYEATLSPADSGFGMYQVNAGTMEQINYNNITDWTDYMGSVCDWRWADELNGMIYEQNGGKPFAWRWNNDDEYSLSILFMEEN